MGYLTRLGHFIETFAEVEESLHQLVAYLAGLDALTAQVILSNNRIANDITAVRELHKVRKTPLPQSLDKALAQLGHINAVRNQLLHHGSIPWAGDVGSRGIRNRVTTNATRKPGNPTSYQVSEELLTQMIGDLGQILIVVDLHREGALVRGSTNEDYLKRFERVSWHCKLPIQEGASRSSPSNNRKPPPRPRSSQT